MNEDAADALRLSLAGMGGSHLRWVGTIPDAGLTEPQQRVLAGGAAETAAERDARLTSLHEQPRPTLALSAEAHAEMAALYEHRNAELFVGLHVDRDWWSCEQVRPTLFPTRWNAALDAIRDRVADAVDALAEILKPRQRCPKPTGYNGPRPIFPPSAGTCWRDEDRDRFAGTVARLRSPGPSRPRNPPTPTLGTPRSQADLAAWREAIHARTDREVAR